MADLESESNVTSSLDKLQLDGASPSAQPGMKILDISGTLLDQPYVAQIWVMGNAIFVWMGSNADKASLSSMSTAVMTRYSPMPLITSIVGAPETEEQQIAQRLARRTGKQCFVSCTLPDVVPELFAFVEKKVLEKLTAEGVLAAKQH